jgi:hypothetical protein
MAKAGEGPEGFLKKRKKPLDKPDKTCYNKGTKGKEKEIKK